MNKQKTILIGIDGCSWNYVGPLLEKGKLPNIERMIQNGSRGILNSTIPPFSPVAWSTFITGKNPDMHGIFDWCKFDEKSNKFKPISARDREATSFWHYLNKAGYKVGVFNLPLTFPAEKIDGFSISGFDSPDDSPMKFYPKELLEKIRKFHGWDMKMIPFDSVKSDEDRLKFMFFYEEYTDKQTDVSLRLIDDYKIDVLIINYAIIDHFNHIIKDYSMIEKGLEIIDRNVGRYSEKYPDANFIVFSDHGSTRKEGGFAIVEWLNDCGYIEITQRRRELVKINTIIHKILKERFKLTVKKEKILRHLLVKPLVILPTTVLSSINHHLSNGKESIRYHPQNAIDYKKSKIIYYSPGSTGIYFNHRRNTRKKETFTEQLIQDLLGICDPVFGKPIIDRVYKKEALYRETIFRKHAPDIILEMSHSYLLWITDVIQNKGHSNNNYFYDKNEINFYGGHSHEGIFILYGENFNNMSNLKEFNLVDLPAIILYLNGVPIPKDFDGIIRKELFSDDFLRFNNIKYQNKKKQTDSNHKDKLDIDSKEVQKRLSDLGYM